MNIKIRVFRPGDTAVDLEKGRLTAQGYSVTVMIADEGMDFEDYTGGEDRHYPDEVVILFAAI